MSIAEKLQTIADNEQKVYEAGKQLEHARMWDVIQKDNNYKEKFNNLGRLFDDTNFYPRYDIRPEGDASKMFYAWDTVTNLKLKDRLEECGVVLDTSKATNLTHAFGYNRMDNLPTIDCTGLVGTSSNIFANAWTYRKTIEKVIVSENTVFQNWFNNCTGLVNITFEGVIGQNGFDVSSCTLLSHDSLMSIINALKDYSEDTSGTTYSVTLGSANLAKLTDAEKATATEKGWTLL